MSDVLSRVNWNIAANDILVTIAVGSHLFPFRTEKLSPPAPMILQFLWESRGRLFKESYRNVTLLFLFAILAGAFIVVVRILIAHIHQYAAHLSSSTPRNHLSKITNVCNVLSFTQNSSRQRGCTQVLSPLPFYSLCAKSMALYAQKHDVWCGVFFVVRI